MNELQRRKFECSSEKCINYENLKKRFYNMYYWYLLELAVNRYEWINLPDEILPQRLEQYLLQSGCALFIYDDIAEMYGVTEVNLGGQLDNYGVPEMRYSYAVNYHRAFDKTNSVLIWDSVFGVPKINLVEIYAASLAEMRLTRDINIKSLRSPVVFSGPKEQELSIKNIKIQHDLGLPYIAVKEGEFVPKTAALDTGANPIFLEMDSEMQKEVGHFLTKIGIDNNSNDKKERLVAGEVTGNNGETEANANSGLWLRKRSAKEKNRLFGLNVDCRLRSRIELAP